MKQYSIDVAAPSSRQKQTTMDTGCASPRRGRIYPAESHPPPIPLGKSFSRRSPRGFRNTVDDASTKNPGLVGPGFIENLSWIDDHIIFFFIIFLDMCFFFIIIFFLGIVP